jgi:hypothetical protein
MRAHGIVTGTVPERQNVAGELINHGKAAHGIQTEIRSLGGEGEGVGMRGHELLGGTDREKKREIERVRRTASSLISGGGTSPEA